MNTHPRYYARVLLTLGGEITLRHSDPVQIVRALRSDLVHFVDAIWCD